MKNRPTPIRIKDVELMIGERIPLSLGDEKLNKCENKSLALSKILSESGMPISSLAILKSLKIAINKGAISNGKIMKTKADCFLAVFLIKNLKWGFAKIVKIIARRIYTPSGV